MSQITVYHPIHGARTIPAVDYAGAWLALGWRREPPPVGGTPVPEPDAMTTTPDPSPALTLINAAADAADMTPIPTVGKGAAGVILRDRPVGGYASLDDLPQAIFEMPYRCDAAQIAEWEG